MKRLVPYGTLIVLLLLAWSAWAQTPATTTPQGWLNVGGVVSLSPGTTTGSVQLGWNTLSPIPASPPLALICNTGSVNAYVKLGNSSVTVTTTNGSIVVNGQCRLLALLGNSYLAAITATSSTTMTIETGSGTPSAKNHGTSIALLPSYLLFVTNGKISLNSGGVTVCNAC